MHRLPSPSAQTGNHPYMRMVLPLRGGMVGWPVGSALGQARGTHQPCSCWGDTTPPKVVARIPPPLWAGNLLGLEQEPPGWAGQRALGAGHWQRDGICCPGHGQLGGDIPSRTGHTSSRGSVDPIHPQTSSSEELPSMRAGGTLASTGQDLVCTGHGRGRALPGMPVRLSKSTALGANSLQLGFESVHPAGAD